MKLNRRLVLCAAALIPFATQAQAQTYPDKPLRIIVGFPAGTGPDIVARLLAQKLSEGWGNLAVVVDNKPGAAGLIAASEAARAAPDGYTLLLAETGMLSIAPSTYNKLPYDPAKDFTPVSQVVTADFVLVTSPQKVPAKDLKGFIDWTRQQSKGLFMGTFGAGTLGHFGAYRFGDAVGMKPEPVHYRNTGDAMTGIMGGDVAGAFASIGLAAPSIKGGKLTALASTGAQRSPLLPELPTFKELGHPDLTFSAWFGIVVPAKTPADIVTKLNADIVRAMKSPDGQKRMEEAGFSATGTSQQAFADTIASDRQAWGKVVAATGFKAD